LVVTTAGETLGSMYISGYLYLDTNNDGVRTAKDASISGARICVIPAGYENNSTYWFSALTDKNGYYKIPLYSPGTYSVAQLYQPQNFIDGKDTPGLVIGADGNPVYAEYGEAIASPDTLDLISGIVLPQGGHAINYNFGELSATGTLLSKRYLLSSTPSSSSGATSYPTHAYNLPDGGNVPEPGTLVLLAAGGVGLVGMAWKRRRQRRQSSSAAAV
jgi:hypothetical protein